MAGRPITNTSERALKRREAMRRLRAQRKDQPAAPVLNPWPLMQAIKEWNHESL